MNYRIVVIGNSWHGSDCTGLARGFRELDHAVELISADQFFPIRNQSLSSRLFMRTLLPYFVLQFNSHILQQVSIIKPNIAVVFKGNYVQTRTLKKIKEGGAWLSNFYPDISFFAHRVVAKEGWPIYNHIFTTKKHGTAEMMEQLGLENVSFLQHGFDGDVHRPMPLSLANSANMQCDISFIGGWSPNKEEHLCELCESSYRISNRPLLTDGTKNRP